MITHPLLQPKQESSRQKVMNLAVDLGTREAQSTPKMERGTNRHWVITMVVYLLIAVPAFLLVPLISYNFGDASSNLVDNLNKLVVFGSPTLLVVAVLVGITGYYGYGRFSWWLSFGFWVSIIVLLLNIGTRISWLNFGIFWIIIGTLGGMFLGCGFELLTAIRRSTEKLIIWVLVIGMVFSAAAGGFAVRNGTRPEKPVSTLARAKEMLPFTIFTPTLIPNQYQAYTPVIAVSGNRLLMYYGDDPYPPPPVIDFLEGLEIIQTKGIDEPVDTSGVRIQVNGENAYYHEDSGRSVIEWQQGDTYIIMTSHSPINGKDLVDAARSFTPYVET